MTRPTLRAALARESPLVTPLAHDALSARLIERAGFGAFAIGGSAMLAARHALPDVGLIGLADMAAGIRDIAAATAIPFLADGDDGYGDVKSVTRLVETYESLGVGGILIEDQQRERKQQRAESAQGVVDAATIGQKLRAALAARGNPDTMIIGRTDAYGVLGLDAALQRADMFLSLGVDGVFVAGLKRREEFEQVGATLRGPFLSAAMFEGGDTPWLTPAALAKMGFTHVSFPATVLFRAAVAMHSVLAELRAHSEGRAALQPLAEFAQVRELVDDALHLARWKRIETEYGPGRSQPLSAGARE
ncbi:MAG TPA: isocitrate lyase/PEP mutase family protein [Alphaproteobacteria bacterium]|nr:isocitrate lyase/PEP mutase family protein [Alphaproteobacteria bacterium]